MLLPHVDSFHVIWIPVVLIAFSNFLHTVTLFADLSPRFMEYIKNVYHFLQHYLFFINI